MPCAAPSPSPPSPSAPKPGAPSPRPWPLPARPTSTPPPSWPTYGAKNTSPSPASAARCSAASESSSELPGDALPAGVTAFRSSDGLTILVGRTASGNQSVTFDLARPRDLWLHARDYPGSHVVLRRAGKREPPPRSVLEAAAL